MTALALIVLGAALALDAAAIGFLVKAQGYSRAAAAYIRGDVRRGDELLRAADDTLRWLP